MKLITVDNFNREAVADALICEGLSEPNAKFLADAANNHPGAGDRYYKAVADDYRLWRGMEDLV